MNPEAAALEITRYEHEGPAPLLDLLSMLWSPDPSLNAAQFHWKYRLNPYPGSRVYVARDAGKIVAMRGFYGARYVAGDGEAPPVMCAGDLVISPEFRSRGVFTEIMQRATEELHSEGFRFLFNFSASAPARLGSLAAGWGTTAQVVRFRRAERSGNAPLSRVGVLRRVVDVARAAQKSATPIGTIVRRLTRWKPFAALDRVEPGNGVTASAAARPREMAELIGRTETDGRIRHVRDEQYFRWRFGGPLSTYRFFFLGTGRLEAYVILQGRHFPMHGKSVRVADWVGVSAEARALVMREALAALPRGTIDVWVSSLEDRDRELLGQNGFLEETSVSAAAYSPAVLVRPLESPIPERPWHLGDRDLLDLEDWKVRLLDSDGC